MAVDKSTTEREKWKETTGKQYKEKTTQKERVQNGSKNYRNRKCNSGSNRKK